MPLIINTNVGSLNAQKSLTMNSDALAKSMEKLASGYRINHAGDDAAGLQVSEKMRAQIRGNQKASDNVQDGINLLNTADATYQAITDSLQRMRELTVQASNDTYNTSQRSAMQLEYNSLASGIVQMSKAAQFNGKSLLGSTAASIKLQIGANTTSNVDDLDISSALVTTFSSAVGGTLTSHTNAQSATTTVDTKIDAVNTARAKLGAFTNRLQYTSQNLANNIENLSASESRVRNVDVAAESSALARNQILQQAAQAMLSQANQSPQLALQLLR